MLEESENEVIDSFENETNYTLEIVESEQGIELASVDRLVKF